MCTTLIAFLFFAALVQSGTAAPQAGKPPETSPATTRISDNSEDLSKKLLQVRRIFVDSFGDDSAAKQVQAIVMTSLAESKRFVITENREKADATLKGTGLENTSQELHAYSEGTAAGHAAIRDSAASTETVSNARLAVRLIDEDGDVIWATTQESKGAKYKGASADVADKVVKQLLRDLEKAEKKREQPVAPVKPS